MNLSLTPAQRRMLVAVAESGPDAGGVWADVQTRFLDASAVPRNLEASTCASVVEALTRKGLVMRSNDGPCLTELSDEIAHVIGGAA